MLAKQVTEVTRGTYVISSICYVCLLKRNDQNEDYGESEDPVPVQLLPPKGAISGPVSGQNIRL